MTAVWYDSTQTKIVEVDIMFNTYYSWGDATLNSSLMDLQDIATHEFGHALGLGDVYTRACVPATMFGYSSVGETYKRTLDSADVTGLAKIYKR